ncbi:MAG: NTP transferase domain-containing protein [Desulfobacterales bacterium]|nr:NTP transferase domain-containing protein [Desulfobacterales bacterium]
MEKGTETASVILAAGRGSRMKEFEGNKTLLPLVPGKSPFEGGFPILLEILTNLPHGPKALVVNYKKETVMEATRNLDLAYCDQLVLNGTGGALIAARGFLEEQDCNELIITMGDVPLVRKATYSALLKELNDKSLVVLGFRPQSKKQYGVLETREDQVRKIIEWNYWKTYSKERQKTFEICNSGIYAAKKDVLLRYLSVLESRPHSIHKEVNGKNVGFEEFFITDIVEYMSNDGLSVGYVLAGDEEEVMGVDDLPALLKAQDIFKHDKKD